MLKTWKILSCMFTLIKMVIQLTEKWILLMFKKFEELSLRRRIHDIQNRKLGPSLYVQEFVERYNREPSDVECLLEIDRQQKLLNNRKTARS